jgi:hypothetical protein
MNYPSRKIQINNSKDIKEVKMYENKSNFGYITDRRIDSEFH